MAKKRSKKKNKKNKTQYAGSSGKNKGGLFIYVPALCTIIGTLMLLVVIAAAVPLTVPNYMGYQVYNVVSGSMEPTIPIGSVIYVRETDPVDIKKGDIIAFESGDSVVMHRVVDNKIVEGTFTTKGDANDMEDINEVPYAALVGIVVRHIPVLGQLLILFGSTFGKICMISFAACGAVLNILGNRLGDELKYEAEQERRREEKLAKLLEEQGVADADTDADADAEQGPDGQGSAKADQ